MRETMRLLAVFGIAAAVTASLPGTASATQETGVAQVSCTYGTDRTTFARVLCETDLRYRVVVMYCRLTCDYEFGPWKYHPFASEVNFPTGGTITSYWSDIGE